MEPTIKVGSLIVVAENQRLVPGDIIAFRSEKNKDTIITHRITSIEKRGERVFLKTKGDANNAVDGWEVSPSNILGKNFLIIPEIGKFLAFARTGVGFPILVIAPAIFVILLELFSIIGEIRKKIKKKNLIHPLSFNDNLVAKHNFTSLKMLIPVIVFAFVAQNTFAFFSDTEISRGNFFAAAESFGTPTPSPTPSVTPTLTPTPTPCGGCCGNNSNNVNVVGGGTGSSTTVIVDNECNSTVNQNNSTNINTSVTQTSSTGGNQNNGNSSNSTTTTSNSTNSTSVTTTTSSNTTN